MRKYGPFSSSGDHASSPQNRFVGEGIEKMVADGEDLGARFEGTQMMRFKLERDGGETKVVGGEMGGDDSG